jgi:hypothetical protein
VLIISASPSHGQTLLFTSPQTQATLIELFTSEGCSSCPPANRWLNKLKNDARLWKEIIPLAFHVDYWNYLGWSDPLSKPAYSRRQRDYAQNGFARSVYTPGFFTNGREWGSWFRKPVLATPSTQTTGTLTVDIDQQSLTARYRATPSQAGPLLLHVAVLGFDIVTPVTRGENRGKTLTHDFVVLAWHTQRDNHAARHWQFNRETIDWLQAHARAIAVWVSAADDPTPLQATGGWIDRLLK